MESESNLSLAGVNETGQFSSYKIKNRVVDVIFQMQRIEAVFLDVARTKIYFMAMTNVS